ncbi:VanZ like family protein [compost metagenome]
MLGTYFLPIGYALLTFPLLAFFFTLPFLIVQYRKYGYVNKVRSLVLYSLLLYLLTALYLVILPLPATTHTCIGASSSFTQWMPFQFVQDIVRETKVRINQPTTYVHLFKERAFLQVVFNILLLVPLGMFLRYYFQRKLFLVVAAAFGLSLFFEITQGTGLYGIYDCPYRLFDVDDLMLNTLGGLLGYALAPLLTLILPHPKHLDDYVDLSATRVSYIRRIIALQIDWFILSFLVALFWDPESPLGLAIPMFAYFVLLPYATNGRTLGKFIVRIRLQGQGPKLKLQEIIMRYGVLYFAIGGLHYLFIIGASLQFHPVVLIPLLLVLFMVDIVLVVHVLFTVFRRDKKLFYETWSGTKNVIT